MKWIRFNPRAVLLPKERKEVLVQLEGTKHLPPAICVGYLRRWSGRNNFFVTPGIWQIKPGGITRKVTHWCDCLEDNFVLPNTKKRKDK